MKFKTTKKSIKENYDTILSIGYCNLQNLLKYQYPTSYSTRVEGWACDYYDIGNVCISTGYSPIGKKVDYEIQMKYDRQAMEIINSRDITCEKKKEKVNELLISFINDVR